MTAPHLPIQTETVAAARPSFPAQSADCIDRALIAAREQTLATARRIVTRLQDITRNPSASAEAQATADRTLASLTALEAQCQGAGDNYAALVGLSAALSSAEAVAVSLESDISAGATRASLQEEAEARVRASLVALHRDLFEKKVLDPYLRFETAEEEEAYRKRERERNAAYDREMAKGTPEGDMRAAQLVQAQVRDAGEHGATASPDFDRLSSAAQQVVSEAKVVQANNTPVAAGKSPPIAPAGAADDIGAALAAAGVNITPVQTPTANHGLPTAARSPQKLLS